MSQSGRDMSQTLASHVLPDRRHAPRQTVYRTKQRHCRRREKWQSQAMSSALVATLRLDRWAYVKPAQFPVAQLDTVLGNTAFDAAGTGASMPPWSFRNTKYNPPSVQFI